MDVVVDGGVGVGQIREGLLVDEFGFEGAPEGFHGGIVVAVAACAHAGSEVMLLEESLKGVAGILGSLIGVMEEAGGRRAMVDGVLEGVADQAAMEGRPHGPADD